MVAAALILLAFTIRSDWRQIFVVLGLILLGLGQGAIVALVFNTLLTAAPKELAGDVGAWRGLVHNLSGSVGIAVASVFAVGVLSGIVATSAEEHPRTPASAHLQVNLDSVNFITNEQLKDVLSQTSASPLQVVAACPSTPKHACAHCRSRCSPSPCSRCSPSSRPGRMPGRMRDELPERLEPDDPDAIVDDSISDADEDAAAAAFTTRKDSA